MKKLPVNVGEVVELMEMGGFETAGYLDMETGRTILLPPELADVEFLEGEDLEELGDEDDELVAIARAIDAGDERYAAVPEMPSDEAYDLMAAFAETVAAELRKLLGVALAGKGPFRRFKDVLLDYPVDEKRWFRFSDEAMEKRAREWLEELGIEAVEKETAEG